MNHQIMIFALSQKGLSIFDQLYQWSMIILVMITNTLRIPRLQFCQLMETNYPYLFGGLPPFLDLPLQRKFLKSLFGENILSQFSTLYLSVLEGLAKKDKEFLQKKLHPTLLNNIDFKDVEFLSYENEELNVMCNQVFFAIGYNLSRENHENLKPTQYIKELGFGIFCIEDTELINKQSIPFTIGTRVLFEGFNRLHLKSQQMIKKKQVHEIQFQATKNVPVEKLNPLVQRALKSQEGYIQEVFGEIQEWKIGDMDFQLRGNKFDI